MEKRSNKKNSWMEDCMIEELLAAFEQILRQEEKSHGTITKYRRDVKAFLTWYGEWSRSAEGGHEMSEAGTAWKESLLQKGCRPVTINSMVCAVNHFFKVMGPMMGCENCRIRTLRIQRKLFWEESRQLSREEFRHLVQTARDSGQERTALLLETIAGTGIRVSEIPFITVEAVRDGKATVLLKGKVRTILLPAALRERLQNYAEQKKIRDGAIFRSRKGTPLSRKRIWAELKATAELAGVELTKVFPHNLRHLFARCFYEESHDLVSLASLLGHSSMETTRIYLLTTESSQQRQIDQLELLC